jgi:16S rRNA (guanine966-N2)-methyltransferase
LRIIAGELKGRKLQSIDTKLIRPTSDMVREALFSILGNMVVDSRFLDLFAGSGGVGIEAYSRGAKEVVFVDSAMESIRVLKKNLEITKIINEIEVIHNDYSIAIDRLSNQGKEFDIVFIDPPYKMGIEIEAARKIQKKKILAKDGIIIIEHEAKNLMPDTIELLEKIKEKKYGNIRLSLYRIKK